MEAKKLIKDKEYVLHQEQSGNTAVFYVHETINHYIFISNKGMIKLTSSTVKNNIYAKEME